MAEITTAMVKKLREATGAGILDVKKALETAEGDMERAVDILREKGAARAAKRSGREASEGVVEMYQHPGGRVGVMLELNCETDFVARNDRFQSLARDLTLQIAAMSPQYIRREDVDPAELEREAEVLRAQAQAEGKPEQVVNRIVQGRMKKFYEEVCLMEQHFVKDEQKTIEDLVRETISVTGENIVVRRFVRYELGSA